MACLAAAIAVSSASLPLLVKKLFCSLPGVICANRSARLDCGSLTYSVEVCESVFICSTIASVTRGLACPTLTVSTPPQASKNRLPVSSQTYIPSPRTSTSGWS